MYGVRDKSDRDTSDKGKEKIWMCGYQERTKLGKRNIVSMNLLLLFLLLL